MGSPVLYPKDFKENEAWVVFQLNIDVMDEAEGGFNCFVLMDVASQDTPASTYPAAATENGISDMEADAFICAAKEKAGRLPATLYVPDGLLATSMSAAAQRHGIRAVIVMESDLEPIIGKCVMAYRSRYRPQ